MGLISSIDHWIAFGLLCLVGAKMILESTRQKPGEKKGDPTSGHVLLMLSIATSIDALAVGVSLAFLEASIEGPAMAIGTVTFLISSLGVYVGNKFGHFLGKRAEAVGGLILIAIGAKMLLEHIF